MTAAENYVDKSRMVDSFPEHVRRQILEILKTGLVNKDYLTNDDILCYLSVSCMSEKLKDACEEKLLDNTTTANCLDAVEIAHAFGLLRLKKEAILLVVKHFGYLWKSESFQCLSSNNLETICKIEKVSKHSDIFKALELWLQHNHEARLKDYCKMLEIVQHKRSPYKRMNSRNKYSTYHAMMMSSVSKSKQSVVTAVFNCDGELVCHRKLFSSTDLKDDFSVACVQKDESDAPYVFISAGKHVFRYDPVLNKEETAASLNHTRKKCSLIACGDCVYAIGGHNSGNMVREIEEFNTKHNNTKKIMKKKWKDVSKIPDKINLRSAPCVVYNNKIYIIGEVMHDCQPSTAILTFTPEDKTVEIVAEFPKACSDCKAIVHDSNIYIASSEGHFLKFDTNTNIFSSCSDLPIKSRNFGMYTEVDMIYIVCGASSDNDVSRFEKDEYDTETNSWKKGSSLPCNLPIYGYCDIKVPSYTNVVPFYDTPFKEIR